MWNVHYNQGAHTLIRFNIWLAIYNNAVFTHVVLFDSPTQENQYVSHSSNSHVFMNKN